MTTPAPEPRASRPRITLWLVVAVVALAAGLIALGSWTLFDRSGSSEPDAARIVDDLNRAVNTRDMEAIRALYAQDAVFEAGDLRASGIADVVDALLIPTGVGLHVRRVAPVTTSGDYAATFIEYSNGTHGVELAVLKFEDGKIVRHSIYLHG